MPIRAVGLGVDSESLTGANRLYESAGMRRIHGHEQWAEALLSPTARAAGST
jgi:hypothetical protein